MLPERLAGKGSRIDMIVIGGPWTYGEKEILKKGVYFFFKSRNIFFKITKNSSLGTTTAGTLDRSGEIRLDSLGGAHAWLNKGY